MSQENQWNLISTGSQGTPAMALPNEVHAGTGRFRLGWTRLAGGRSEGVDVLTVDSGAVSAAILPTRGMGIWKCWAGENEIGWQSPVAGPVHPCWVPIMDPSGIGWLEGFDEFFVRCGLESNGAPEFDSAGILRYPLHGRIANLPAQSLSIEVDPLAGALDIRARVDETRFLIRSLSLEVHMRFRVGSPIIEITDTVTNQSSRSTSMQLLYHINVGQPLLEAGSKLSAPIRKLSPRNDYSAKSIDTWSTYAPPSPGFAEQVYFADPFADENGWSTALLHDSRSENGLAVHFDTRTLPYLVQWKNTAAVEDGYVTGIEPATGFPNPRSFEESRGRLVNLSAGESRRFRLKLEPLTTADKVAEQAQRIHAMQQSSPQILSAPDPSWAS